MQYMNLGKTGLKVSRICLGMMSYGTSEWRDWVLDEADSRPFVRRALEMGINFFDTADMYSRGVSEEVTGKMLWDFARRDEVVLATKVFFPFSDKPNMGGLSRKHIMHAVEDSLRRLGTDYIDLYQIHRYDYHTPIEETLEALHDLVRSGKVRYIGASSMFAYQFARSLYLADLHGWTRFVSMQNHYNLIYREEEREMLPLCIEEGIAITPYSPLASGRLARAASETSARYETDKIAKMKYDATAEADQMVIERVVEIAEKYAIPMAHVSLAWMLHKKPIAAPVIGATKIAHLESAVEAVDLKLEPDDIAFLEEPYTPHPVVGLIPYGG